MLRLLSADFQMFFNVPSLGNTSLPFKVQLKQVGQTLEILTFTHEKLKISISTAAGKPA
jgi:hypothetical protein